MNKITSEIAPRLGQFLLAVELLHMAAYGRFIYFYYVRRRMVAPSDGVAENTAMHNMRGVWRSVTHVSRSNVFIRPYPQFIIFVAY